MGPSQIVFVAMLLSSAQHGASVNLKAHGRQPKKEPPRMMSKAETRCAYRLMEATCPFPSQVLATAAPLTWELAAALGRATSLSTSGVFTHLLILVSLVLGGVRLARNFMGAFTWKETHDKSYIVGCPLWMICFGGCRQGVLRMGTM